MPNETDNIVLLGFMGTGKTTVGRLIAERLGRPFVDLDDVIEERAGCAISDIFAREGEKGFRAREREVVRDLAAGRNHVLAAGGGVVLNPDNVRDLKAGGLLVCLLASPQTVLQRVSAQSHRPLLEDGEKAARIRSLLDARRALYEAIPFRIDTDTLTPPDVAERILQRYRSSA